MPDYRIELHGSTIDNEVGTLREELVDQLKDLAPAHLGAIIQGIIDCAGYLRIYVLADGVPVGVLYRERADKLLRELDPPAQSQLCWTASSDQFKRDTELTELPKVFDGPRGLQVCEWGVTTTLWSAHRQALARFDEPVSPGAVVFYRDGTVMAAWERSHVGTYEPRLVAVNAAALR